MWLISENDKEKKKKLFLLINIPAGAFLRPKSLGDRTKNIFS